MRPYTAMNPGQRIKRLLDFNERMNAKPESMDTLSEWQLNFDSELVQVKGRQIAGQKIFLGNKQKWETERMSKDGENSEFNHFFLL